MISIDKQIILTNNQKVLSSQYKLDLIHLTDSQCSFAIRWNQELADPAEDGISWVCLQMQLMDGGDNELLILVLVSPTNLVVGEVDWVYAILSYLSYYIVAWGCHHHWIYLDLYQILHSDLFHSFLQSTKKKQIREGPIKNYLTLTLPKDNCQTVA